MHEQTTRALALWLLLTIAPPGAADSSALTGRWSLDKDTSGALSDEINQLKQEHRLRSSQYGSINDPDKPDPFSSRSRNAENYDTRPSGPVANASATVRRMVSAKSLKLYVSDRIVVAYDGKLKRLITPNPNGRVHSASGKGTSRDAIGDTLAYIENDAIVIETRTKSAERLTERFELTGEDRLKVTTSLKNPDWRREIEFVRFYDRKGP